MKKRFSNRAMALVIAGIVALSIGMGIAPSMPQAAPAPLEPQATIPAGTQAVEDKAQESTQAKEVTPAEQSQPQARPQSQVAESQAQDEAALANEAVLRQFEVSAEPAVAESAEEVVVDEPFVMPAGADYEPDVALFAVDPSASAEEVNAAVSALAGFEPTNFTDEDLQAGYVTATLAEGYSVEDAVNELMTTNVVEAAQPNYAYDVEDLLDGEEITPGAIVSDELDLVVPSNSDAQQQSEMATQVVEQGEPSSAADAGAAPASSSVPAAEPASSQDESAPAATNEQALTDDADAAAIAPAETAEQEGIAVATEEGVEGATSAEDTEGAVDAEAAKLNVNDPSANKQWGLDSIHAYEAWKLQSSNSGVTVAVMDVGFNINHEDLAGNVLTRNNSKVTYNAAYNNTSSVYTVARSGEINYNHGTHVSGVISAVSNNNLGVSGASYNAKVLPIMMARNDNKIYSDAFANAFNYIMKNKNSYGIRVVNFSLGSGEEFDHDGTVKRAIKNCYDNGIVVVTSAGNLGSHSGAYAHYPSDYPYCMAVMSLKKSGSGVSRSSTSNYNRSLSDHKDICAPGDSIFSTLLSGYGTMSGTSMATPFVSATAALVCAANSSLSAGQVIDILHGTATDLGATGFDVNYGYGEVNAYLAVLAAKNGLSNVQKAQAQEQQEAERRRQEEERRQQEEAERQRRAAAEQQQRDSAAASSVIYHTHVQTYGWQNWVGAGAMSGTSGESKRLEAIEIKLSGAPYAGGIQYRTHVQTYGWQGWAADGGMAGTSGESKRLEAIEIQLTGEMANHYSVWYRVHAQTYGWLGWTRDGGRAGTATLSKRLEAIEIQVLPKSAGAPGSTSTPYVTRQVRYKTHVQTYGWQDWVYDGGMSGTSGESKRLEAIQIELYGDMADHYDVWYCVHAQTYGWLGWAANGAQAGTAGLSRRLEAIQIVLVPKGSGAPGSTATPFVQG